MVLQGSPVQLMQQPLSVRKKGHPIPMAQPLVMHTSENTKSSKEKIGSINDFNNEAQYERPLSAKKMSVKKYDSTNTGTNREPSTNDTTTIQPLPARKMSVPHCHVHLIPRKASDYANNDDIYKDIEKSSKVDNEEKLSRSLEEMAKEAKFLRQFFKDSK
ncbi:8432_t:CDS:2 [Gigaspora margarita]|uniref:8432_t:CDS:1 n=1 Tax=Gigaspora margarita TaxID=4874 RepID=A0ABN7UBS0_GIGMA|nr:8432_t:CDS:2 [Gigaspora margarita]